MGGSRNTNQIAGPFSRSMRARLGSGKARPALQVRRKEHGPGLLKTDNPFVDLGPGLVWAQIEIVHLIIVHITVRYSHDLDASRTRRRMVEVPERDELG
jgi:hypothetical protein